ncbi:PAS domain S-box protein [Methylomonas sp. AM2-LC]|uniref:PAS domain S-box protein n=1 Tax=Methylomonas sp. AM2-LC TaxID=3153301 RepID=UPI00326692E8
MQIAVFKPTLLAAFLIPLLACGMQWLLWDELKPLTWILFYPAVFFSARYAGLSGGLFATCLSVVLADYLFMEPRFSLAIADTRNWYSMLVFLSMGTLFSLFFAKLHASWTEIISLQSLELKNNQQRLTQALHAANAGIWEWNLQDNSNQWTDNLWSLYGLERNVLPASYDTWLSTVHNEDREVLETAIKMAVENQQPLNIEWRLAQTFNGQERWLMGRGQPEYNATGQLIFYRGIVIDISERKCIEQQLRDKDTRLNFVLDKLQLGVWEINLHTQQAHGSLQHSQLFGYSELQNNWNYSRFLEHVVPEHRQLVETTRSETSVNLKDWHFECQIQRVDGEIRWISVNSCYLFDHYGQVQSMAGLVQDITQRKQNENNLRYADIRYRTLFDQAAPDALFVHNHQGNFIEVNKQACESLGYSKQELLGMNVIDLEQDFNLSLAQQVWNSVVPGETQILLGQHKRKDGSSFPVEVHLGVLVFDEQRYYIGVVRDITQRLAAEHALKDSEARYREMFEANPHPMWVYDVDTLAFLAVNDAAVAHYGYSRAEFLAMTIKDIRSEAEVKRLMEAITANTFGVNAFDLWRHICSDGREILVEISTHSMHFSGHRAMVALVQDVTLRVSMVQQLRKLSMAIEQTPESIVITDLNGKIDYVNSAFLRNSGYSQQEVLGNSFAFLKSGLTSADTYTYLWQTLHNEQIWKGEFVNRRKDGSDYTEFATISPIRDASGKVTHYVGIQEDISEKKKLNAELAQYRHHLEELVEQRTLELEQARSLAESGNAAKTNFLSNMSHEIRTPMNAVLGLCYLLEQRPLDEDSHQLVKKINSAGRSLLCIINDILDFSKIEAGHLEIELAPFRLSEMLDELGNLMSAAAVHKNLELLIVPPVDADALIGDGLRLKQVLINLLSNAIKFTEQGEVELRITLESEQADQLKLRFLVKDSGIGIAEDQLQDLFSAFTQADNSISRRFGGTGLGLSISRQLVQLMGGEVQVKSCIGEGSEFWFVLPLQRDLQLGIVPASLNNLQLLVVDDNENACEALQMTAKSLGWHALAVNSGQAALLKIMESKDEKLPYDVFLIDWKMPGLDGVATTELIRKLLPETGIVAERMPIILMVTSYSLKELQLKSTPTLADGILSKPITASALYNTVCRVIVGREQSGASAFSESTHSKVPRIPGVRVLVVDDSEINREVAQRVLQDEGALVYLASDGQEALEWLSRDVQQVDVILMDIQMPRLDGYEATRRIRQLPHCANLPILALTAGAFKSLQQLAFDAGMNDFIPKPFDVAQMMTLIQHWTLGVSTLATNIHTPAESRKLVVKNDHFPLLRNIYETNLDIPGVNQQIVQTYWKDAAIYKTFLRRFVTSYQQAGLDLQAAQDKGDINAAKALAHKLKGMVSNLGLDVITQHCIAVEQALANQLSLQIPAQNLQMAINELAACLTVDTQVNILPREDYTLAGKRSEILQLVEQLQTALSLNNPGNAEPLMAALEAELGHAVLVAIKDKVLTYSFREAESLLHELSVTIRNS